MLVPPRRPHFPPDAPDIAAIASWVAGVYRPSFGFHLWTVENVTAAVDENLGVGLSPVGARSVIAAEHARRRPDYYRRLAWKRRGKKWRIRSQRSASNDAHAQSSGPTSVYDLRSHSPIYGTSRRIIRKLTDWRQVQLVPMWSL